MVMSEAAVMDSALGSSRRSGAPEVFLLRSIVNSGVETELEDEVAWTDRLEYPISLIMCVRTNVL